MFLEKSIQQIFRENDTIQEAEDPTNFEIWILYNLCSSVLKILQDKFI